MILAVLAFLGFTKDIPFTQGYILKAQFQSANSIRPNSPVRIAGVDVGKVKKIEPLQGTNAAVLVMEIKKTGLPLHADATAKIRPRIFLEGNFFVDLKPGTPQSPQLHSGDTLKISQTATPVQLDQVLTSLQSDSRQDLKDVLQGVSTGLNDTAGGKQQSAAQSLNDALDDIPQAEASTSQVLDALRGTQPGEDVERLIRGTAATSAALDRNEGQLQGLITSLNDDDGDVRGRVLEPQADDRRARADAADRQRDADLAQQRVPADARVRQGDPAGRQGDAGDDRRGVPVDRADAQRWSARTSSAAWPSSSRRRRLTSRS